ncbi:hypothetical protein [Allosphingosinicella sp.]|jgi:hypothetical protein|uniref:hypothetical protein n=1 Tax=Allosphingosinicella sp. TaxID=2823234 RepID=UPI002F207FBC
MKVIGAAAILVLTSGGAALAADTPHPLVEAALRCRAETNDQLRLRCYDAALNALEQGITRGTVVTRVRDEREGWEIPNEFEAAVRSARHSGFQRWTVVLETGGTWETMEDSSRQALPRRGEKVKISRAALGNYWMSVEGGRRLKVRRIA